MSLEYNLWLQLQHANDISNEVDTNTTDITTLQGQVSALNPLCGQWYRSSNQTITTTGAPSSVSISWGISTKWTDQTAISEIDATTFKVHTHGVYRLDLQVLYNNLNTAILTDRTLRIYIRLARGVFALPLVISQTNMDVADNTPANAGVSTSILYELEVDDVLSFQTVQFLSSGSFVLVGSSSYDLNTLWSWQLIKLL